MMIVSSHAHITVTAVFSPQRLLKMANSTVLALDEQYNIIIATIPVQLIIVLLTPSLIDSLHLFHDFTLVVTVSSFNFILIQLIEFVLCCLVCGMTLYEMCV